MARKTFPVREPSSLHFQLFFSMLHWGTVQAVVAVVTFLSFRDDSQHREPSAAVQCSFSQGQYRLDTLCISPQCQDSVNMDGTNFVPPPF